MSVLMERIRGLSPAHQQDVMNIAAGAPTLKHKFYSGTHGYNGTTTERSTLLDRFEQYAQWTIPALFPPEDISGAQEVQLDYQSFGAQAVNNLANKIVTTLFHPTRPFFKAQAPDEYVKESGRRLTDIDADLSALEKKCMVQFAERDGRTVATDATMQLIVTGNVLWNMHKGQPYRHFTYRDYDASFDVWGEMTHCIVREWINVNALSAKHAQMCMQYGKRENDMVEVFTGIKRIALGYYVVWQELENFKVLSEDYSVYSKDTLPWKPQRWLAVPGRQAGVGLIEQMAGDFHTLSKMSMAELDLIAVMCDIKTIVKPGGTTKIKDLNEALPGAYVPGNPDDFESHSHDVANQMQWLDKKMQGLIRRLSQMFLLNSNAIRDAERVTAEEIRYVAQELDQVHGGVYSRVARSLQRPIAVDLMRNESPIFKSFKPLIITGLESLSRMSELDMYRGFINDMTTVGTALQGAHGAWVNVENLTKKFASGWGIDINEVVFTPEQKRKEEERQLELQAKLAMTQGVR